MRIMLSLVALALLAGGYMLFLSPTAQKKRAVDHALEQWNEAVAAKDAPKMRQALETLIAHDAAITLDVSFSAISVMQTPPALSYALDRAGFIALIEQTTGKLTDYAQTLERDGFETREGDMADLGITGFTWGDSTALLMLRSVPTRYSGHPECKGEVAFTQKEKNGQPALKTLHCTLNLQIAPKPASSTDLRGELLQKP